MWLMVELATVDKEVIIILTFLTSIATRKLIDLNQKHCPKQPMSYKQTT